MHVSVAGNCAVNGSQCWFWILGLQLSSTDGQMDSATLAVVHDFTLYNPNTFEIGARAQPLLRRGGTPGLCFMGGRGSAEAPTAPTRAAHKWHCHWIFRCFDIAWAHTLFTLHEHACPCPPLGSNTFLVKMARYRQT